VEELLVEVIQNMRLEIKDLQEQIKEKTLDREVVLDSVRRANALVDSMIDGARKLQVENEQLRKDSGRAALVQAVARENHKIEQVLAQALGGYPRYADDPKTFPDALPDDPTVFVGIEIPLTLAMQAADEIKRLRAELEESKSKDK
jgi:hypothetical protein